MTDLIFNSGNGFTSVKEPYASDKFVSEHFKAGGKAEFAVESYATFFNQRPLLRVLLGGIAKANGSAAVEVVDCGVFMGTFTVAASIQAKSLGIPTRSSAYEANAALMPSIQANLDIYGVKASLHPFGIGGKCETVDFFHLPDALIGGTAHDMYKPRPGDVVSQCQLITLKEALPNDTQPGLVKLDLEGNEVDAFLAIADDEARLHNVFVIEFAESQAACEFGGTTFGEFLLSRFDVFDASDWQWAPYIRPIPNLARLSNVVKEKGSNRAANTDLVLIPKGMTALSGKVAAMAAK